MRENKIKGYIILIVVLGLIVALMCSFNTKVSRASWYGPGFHGKLTANGEVYNQNCFTSASPTLPFGTLVEVTNLHNGKSVIVRVNDRGPYTKIDNKYHPHPRRKLDLSKASFDKISNLNKGVIDIQYKILNN